MCMYTLIYTEVINYYAYIVYMFNAMFQVTPPNVDDTNNNNHQTTTTNNNTDNNNTTTNNNHSVRNNSTNCIAIIYHDSPRTSWCRGRRSPAAAAARPNIISYNT